VAELRPIHRLYIANRGEVVARIARTCRALGIGTAAPFAQADAGQPYLDRVDLAVALPGPAPLAPYLSIEAQFAAARAAGADAVRPGYGFLAESAAFARACIETGLVFLGPGPEAMETMACKPRARAAAETAGVPIVPGADATGLDDEAVVALIAGLHRARGSGGRAAFSRRLMAGWPARICAFGHRRWGPFPDDCGITGPKPFPKT